MKRKAFVYKPPKKSSLPSMQPHHRESVLVYPGIQEARLHQLNTREVVQGRYVLYWMQQSQRADANHALEYAVQEANRLGQSVVVAFALTDDYPEANLRHYTFMLEGLRETELELEKRGIRWIARRGPPPEVALEVGREASLIVCDRGYLRHQRAWRVRVAHEASCRVVQVESDLIVPAEAVSAKAEIAARTLRPRIHRQLDEYLKPVFPTPLRIPSLDLEIGDARPHRRFPVIQMAGTAAVLHSLEVDRGVAAVSGLFKGGSSHGKRLFAEFLKDRLKGYAHSHVQPQNDLTSHMSLYLHFGQVSPLYMALEVNKAPAPGPAKDAFLEQMIVRRELACNFTLYTPDYDSYACIPEWARKTLAKHRADRRPSIYSPEQLAGAATHDPYWNAAMREMVSTGFLNNYLRMYWGKKILEWSRTPEEGFAATLYLNNKYFLDGRDPNSFAGVAWVYGVHDRPWPERTIYGSVRTMTASGLERKCDIKAYVQRINEIWGRP